MEESKVDWPPGNGELCPPRLPGSSRETFEVNHSVPALWSLGVHSSSPTACEAGRSEGEPPLLMEPKAVMLSMHLRTNPAVGSGVLGGGLVDGTASLSSKRQGLAHGGGGGGESGSNA